VYYLQLRFNSTAYQHTVRTRLSICPKMPHFTACDVWICLEMQNMIVEEQCSVLILHYVSIYFHTLYDAPKIPTN